MKHPLPLRYSLPMALGLLAGLLACLNFGLDWVHTTQAVEALTGRRAAALGNLMARNLERHFSRNDTVAVAEEIVALNGVPNLTVGLVCDETDRILSATAFNLRQVPFAETAFGGAAPLLARARTSLTAQFEVTPDGAAVRAAFPLTMGLRPGELRSSRIAVFYTQTDLAGLMRAEQSAMVKRSLAMAVSAGLGALGIWFYLRSTLTRRVESLVQATREVAAGNLAVETRLQGSDELATLGASFNHMAAQLRERNAALQASEARLHAIVHRTPNVAIQGYDADGRVQLWNDASVRMFGWSAEEATGRTLDELIYTPEQAAEFVRAIRTLAGTGQSVGPVENPFRRRNGEAGQLLSTLFEVAGTAGQPLFVCMDVDITERKQAAVRLQQSQEQFQTLFRSSPLPGVLLSPETARFVDVNDRFAEVSGYGRDEVVGRSGEDLGLWCDLADRDRLLAALQRHEELHGFEVRLRTKHGRTLDTLLSAQRIDLPVGPVVMVQAVDLTERKRSEEALREKDRLLREVIDLVPHFIFAKDRESRFLFANRAAAAAAGLTPDEIVGRTDLDLGRDPGVAAGFVRDDQEVFRNGTPKFVAEERLTDAAGRELIMQTFKAPFQLPGTGEPAVLGVAVNITERQRAEEALRVSQAMIATIINTIPVRVFWKDRELRYLGCNVAFAQDAGFAAPADVMGKDDYQMGWRDQADRYRADDRRIIEAGTTHLHIEEQMTLPDGQTITLLTSKTPLRNAAGEITGVLGTYLDITARKEAEATRANLESQLRQAQKMEAIGTLAGGIAHDFNNILGVILSNAQLAALDTAPGHPAAEGLAEITAAGQRAKALVEQILAFSRQQPTRRQVVEAPVIVAEVTRFLKATLPASVDFVTDLEPGCPPILADATQVHQILVNLVTNAWHALGDQPGRICLGLRSVPVPEKDVPPIPDLPAGKYVRFTVSDTGCGMDSATLKRIFDPFFTTKPPGQGTGLGLSVVHGIVQQHHGAVQVDSQPGVGSTFTVYLPAAAPTPIAAPPGAEPANRPTSSLRVLILDDEEALLQVSRRLLTRLGHRVEGFGQPAAALARFREDPGAFDLVITDFNMPGQSGLAIAAEIFRLRPGLPILLISGKVTDDLRRRAQDLGIREVLNKPVALDELKAAVNRVAAHGGT
jgi:PAS domain S-box-containing protein